MIRYDDKVVVRLSVNGETREACIRPSDLLLDVLREQLGLTSTKPGWKTAIAACTVTVDACP